MRERNGTKCISCKESLGPWNSSTAPRSRFRGSLVKSPDIRLQYFNESTRPGTNFRSTNESWGTQTLMVFGLDHLLSEQEVASEEIEAVRKWLQREGTCLLL